MFVLGQTLCLVFTFGWKWGQCLWPRWEPTGICCVCLYARHSSCTHTHTLTDTNRHTLWQATSFSLCDLAGWECGACHLSKVSAAYMLWNWKLSLTAVSPLFLSLLTVLYWRVLGQRGKLTPASRQVFEPPQQVCQLGKPQLERLRVTSGFRKFPLTHRWKTIYIPCLWLIGFTALLCSSGPTLKLEKHILPCRHCFCLIIPAILICGKESFSIHGHLLYKLPGRFWIYQPQPRVQSDGCC